MGLLSQVIGGRGGGDAVAATSGFETPRGGPGSRVGGRWSTHGLQAFECLGANGGGLGFHRPAPGFGAAWGGACGRAGSAAIDSRVCPRPVAPNKMAMAKSETAALLSAVGARLADAVERQGSSGRGPDWLVGPSWHCASSIPSQATRRVPSCPQEGG